jgi:hypothetical protein
MHILTYPVGRKLTPFMSTEHLIAGLQAAIERSVFSTRHFYNVNIVTGHHWLTIPGYSIVTPVLEMFYLLMNS